jgi:hypothetical protein
MREHAYVHFASSTATSTSSGREFLHKYAHTHMWACVLALCSHKYGAISQVFEKSCWTLETRVAPLCSRAREHERESHDTVGTGEVSV